MACSFANDLISYFNHERSLPVILMQKGALTEYDMMAYFINYCQKWSLATGYCYILKLVLDGMGTLVNPLMSLVG